MQILPENINVSIGINNLSSCDGIDVQVKEVFINKDYNPNRLDHDIAVLRLISLVTYSKNIKPINLPKESIGFTKGSVVSWGYVDDSGNIPDNAQKATFEIEEDTNSTNKFRAKNYKTYLCSGDSGSGVYSQHFIKTYLIGIVSSKSKAKCSEYSYFKFIDVFKYIDFIKVSCYI